MVDVHVRSGQLHLVAVRIAVSKILAFSVDISLICIKGRVITDRSDRNRLLRVPEGHRAVKLDFIDRPVGTFFVRLHR